MAIAPLEKMSLMTSRRLLVEVGNWNAVAVEASSAATAAIWLLKSIIMSVVCCVYDSVECGKVRSGVSENERSKSHNDRRGREESSRGLSCQYFFYDDVFCPAATSSNGCRRKEV